MAYLDYPIDIYAAPANVGSGDGSSEANAMALNSALAIVVQGENIGAIPGNYSKAYPGGNEASWQITNDGAVGAPIRVIAKFPASLMADPTSDANASRLRHTGSFGTGTGGPIVGCYSKSYQDWIGFVLDENFAPPATDMGTAETRQSDHCSIQYCRMISIVGDPGFVNDNHSGVAVRFCQDILVANNMISGYNQNMDIHNYNGLERYDTERLTVEHNEIFDCANGIYFKDSPSPDVGGVDEVARFNYIYDCRIGIEIACTEGVGGGGDYYQNIVEDCSYGFFVSQDTLNVVIYNNTLVCDNDDSGEGGPLGGMFCGADTTAYNNICVIKTSGTVLNERYRTDPPWLTNYNRYYATGGGYFYRHDSGNFTSLLDWQAAFTVDDNSTEGNPGLVDLVGGDLHLAPGSVSLTLGNTGGPIGAYITGNEVIGIEPEDGPAPPASVDGYSAGTAISFEGVMQTIFLADGSPVPPGSFYLNGIAHDNEGQRYVALWPGSGIVTYSSGRALRTDGAQCILGSAPSVYLAGFGYSGRGELCVTISPGPNYVNAISVNNGLTAVSDLE